MAVIEAKQQIPLKQCDELFKGPNTSKVAFYTKILLFFLRDPLGVSFLRINLKNISTKQVVQRKERGPLSQK